MRTLKTQYQQGTNRGAATHQRTFSLALLIFFISCGNIAQAKDRVIDVDIQSQQTDKALLQLAESTGIQIMFAEGIGKYTLSAAVAKGTLLNDALTKILENTGLSFEYSSEDLVVVQERNRKIGSRKGTWKKGVKVAGAQLAQLEQDDSQQHNSQDSNTGKIYPSASIVEEIVVTAQIREENLQDVPVSVTAFSGETLENDRLFSLEDIARFTPGFTGSNFSQSNPIFAVRGANNTFNQAGASKPVGVFIDGVFVPRYSAANFDLFDLEQIAVLRGPQGTLFGRNVTGGALQITTSKPSLEKSEAKLKAGFGNLGYFEAAAFGNIPLSDRLAGKASINYKKRDGYITDRFDGQDYNDIETLSLRGQFLYEASADIEVIFSVDYAKDDNNSRGYSLVSNSAGTDFSDNDGDIRTAETNTPQDYDRSIFGTSLRVNWDLAMGTLTSISAYRQSETRELYNFSSGDVALPTVSIQFIKDEKDDPTIYTQELRFVSNKGDRFDYVTGFYYYNEDTERNLNDLLLGVNGLATFFDRTYDVKAETESIALYADVTVHLFDSVDLSFGGRYTYEDKSVRVNFIDNNNATNNFTVTPESSFNEFTSRIAIKWAVNDSINLFASRTEGFTAGGFNTETNSIPSITLGFEPETITAYEIGAKTQWFDGQLIFNLSGFTQDFENKQEGVLIPGQFFGIFNASEASMEGVEVEANWVPIDGMTVNLGYSYLDATYDSFITPTGDFSGNRLQTAPKHTFSAGFNYRRPISIGGSLLFNASYTWQDSYFTGASNIPAFLIDSYGLTNASIGYESRNGKWKISVWGKNIADKEYVLIRGTTGALAEYYGAPRTYGATVTFNY